MVRLTKIYTRTGDKGKTALVGGQRVDKFDPRVETYGTIDELNACIGLIRTSADTGTSPELRNALLPTLQRIQNALFDIGSLVATAAEDRPSDKRRFTAAWSRYLENRIDDMQKDLEPLDSFVLPGGSVLNAQSHLARTVCRRAERTLWHLHQTDPLPEEIPRFVNRLSDYLFVLSRWVSSREGKAEYLWEPGLQP